MIKELSIDLETYSDVDIKKCGAYKYAESDRFEILLFAYAVNSGDVQVIDLARGEKIPEELDEETLATLEKFFDNNLKEISISSIAYPDEFIEHGSVEQLEELKLENDN